MPIRFIIAAAFAWACSVEPNDSKAPSPAVTDPGTGTDDLDDTASDANEGGDTGTADPAPGVSFSVTVREDCVVCATVELTVDEAAPVTLLVGPEGGGLSAWAHSPSTTDHRIPVLELTPDTAYEVAVRIETTPSAQSAIQTFRTGPLPDHFPPIEAVVSDADRTESGVTIMTVVEWTPHEDMDGNFLVALNEEGTVIWYEQLTGLNVGLHVDDLKRIYTTESVLSSVRVDPYGASKTVWTAESLGIETMHHEVRPTEDGGLATITTEHTLVPGWFSESFGFPIAFDIISDILATFDADGRMTWSWSLIDHFDPLEHHTDDLHMAFWTIPPYDHLDYPKDWSHGNAMVPNDGSWLASFRNLDWLIQVDPDTDKVDFVFGWGGDFELETGGRWFSRQHAPEVLENGNILLYDNGNDRADRVFGEQPYSRVVEYSLDLDTMKATEEWSWDGGTPRVFCPIVGDADELAGGNHLITDGAVYETTTFDGDDIVPHFTGRVREVANIRTDPEVVWEVRVGTPGDYETPSWVVYRSVKVDSLYPAYAQPR